MNTRVYLNYFTIPVQMCCGEDKIKLVPSVCISVGASHFELLNNRDMTLIKLGRYIYHDERMDHNEFGGQR